MFQWFIRKCIPLSFAKDELPFLSKWVQKKIDRSEVLQKEKKKYQIHRSHFQLLHDQTLKQESFEDYWQELESKLQKEKIENKKEIVATPPKISYTGLFLPRLAMGFAIFIAAFLFVQPGIFEQENPKTQNSTLTIHFPIWNNLKEKISG